MRPEEWVRVRQERDALLRQVAQQCERVATVTIPLDELLAALREWRPDWFEVTP